MYTSPFTLQILKVLLVDFGIDTQDFNNKYALTCPTTILYCFSCLCVKDVIHFWFVVQSVRARVTA